MQKLKHTHFLSADIQVKVIAFHKNNIDEFTQIMTFGEWLNLKKNKNYFYKCLQLN